MITERRLQKIEARHAATTLGEWWAYAGCVFLREPTAEIKNGCGEWNLYSIFEEATGPIIENNANALFAAEAHHDVPDLVAEVKRLRDLVRRLADADPIESEWGTCVFCGGVYNNHAGDCPWVEANRVLDEC